MANSDNYNIQALRGGPKILNHYRIIAVKLSY